MSALEELLSALRQAVRQAQSARVDVSAALDRWDERRSTLEWWLTGTADPDAQAVLGHHEVTAEEMRSALLRVVAAVEIIESYIRDLEGASSGSVPGGATSHGGNSGGGANDGGSPPTVQAPDGSYYPDAAAGVVDALPPRVRSGTGADRTVGFMGGAVGQPITSGFDQTWSVEVQRNAVARGIAPRTARFLSSHVELKAAEKMIREGRQHSELVINNIPCELQPGKGIGCEQAIERYLPPGSSLTVHGTTQDGNPFTRTYKGKA
ncbi:DddA-like double-stranded DNA deaminase toxin [Saccharopolyspora endophytica]|uniref:SCP1.201-like deaminase n=1 Tax=Saccharopolyspora endophytica TaxID=543886 RepID=A0ABS5DKB9_9PSEU|nr:DddA-like double-stranded DNA deaminase toxin [Saccharopolyspora endophytica]MBQ0926739.1 hypothetical protein [Saccharopolyspora endophytica]